jgi:hypothetical protein
MISNVRYPIGSRVRITGMNGERTIYIEDEKNVIIVEKDEKYEYDVEIKCMRIDIPSNEDVLFTNTSYVGIDKLVSRLDELANGLCKNEIESMKADLKLFNVSMKTLIREGWKGISLKDIVSIPSFALIISNAKKVSDMIMHEKEKFKTEYDYLVGNKKET